MSEIDYLDLLSGRDITYDDVCVLHPPTLSSICEIGSAKYNSYVNVLCFDLDKYFRITEASRDILNEIPDLCIFDILISDISMRECLKDSLSFFISGEVEYVDSYRGFRIVYNDTITIINRNNFEDIQSAILQLNFVSQKKPSKKLKFRNKYAQELYEECGEDNGIANPDFNLSNLIASVIAYHGAYTYENIWSLTVYQLYDLFFRLNSKNQLSIYGLRWAAWGTEDFDFDVWYKDIHTNVKET